MFHQKNVTAEFLKTQLHILSLRGKHFEYECSEAFEWFVGSTMGGKDRKKGSTTIILLESPICHAKGGRVSYGLLTNLKSQTLKSDAEYSCALSDKCSVTKYELQLKCICHSEHRNGASVWLRRNGGETRQNASWNLVHCRHHIWLVSSHNTHLINFICAVHRSSVKFTDGWL
jgi:hypothetical protein